MAEVRDFQPEDADAMELRPHDAVELDGLPWRQWVRDAAEVGRVWTVLSGGRVVAVGGATRPWPTLARLWSFIGAGMPPRAWVAVHRVALRELAALEAEGVLRIDAEVAAGWAAGERWARMLGLTQEGVLRRYDRAGRDVGMWSRVVA